MQNTDTKVARFCRALANTLANNHVYCSLTKPRLVPSGKSGFEGILKTGVYESDYQRRVVAIVGAGASYEGNLLLAQETVKSIRDECLEGENRFKQKVVDLEVDKISKTYGWEKKDFETQLKAFCTTEYGASVTLKKLTEYFGFRYRPLLAYEIIAHLLKHRFLDAVINYNFDELLDQSIADELQPNEYDYVLSDGDLDPSGIRYSKTLERPIYIKPHGTVSHPATLRFTHKAYYKIPRAISELLAKLFTQKNLDLIVFGFSLDSLEVQDLLGQCKNNSVRIFVIDINEWVVPEDLKSKIKEIYQINPLDHFNSRKNTYGIRYFGSQNKPSMLFWELWRNVSNAFNKKYRPRDIKRHELVSNLFYVGPEKKDNLASPRIVKEPDVDPLDYLWSRTVIEIMMAVARGRGFISIPHLVRDRAGNYYREYVSRRRLLQPRNENYVPMTLVEICIGLGMVKQSYSDVVMTFGIRKPDCLLVPEKERDSFLKALIANLKSTELNLPRWLISRVKQNRNKGVGALESALKDLYQDGDVEIRLDIPEVYDAQINQFTYLGSRTAIKYATYEILNDENYKYVQIVSEVGEWMLRDEEIKRSLRKKKKIQLVIADKNNLEEIRSVFDNIEIRHRDWWLHNRHMTLAFKHEPVCSRHRTKCKKTCKGIFWNRRLRTPDLRPILIVNSNSIDAQLAFNLYWSKSNYSVDLADATLVSV